MDSLTRRSVLAGGSYGLAMSQAPAPRPNILFICADQHSAPVVGASGHPIVKTPNLDRLAASGTNFQTAYCGSPVCAPGRACMMTGLFASDVQSYCNSTPFDGHVPGWGNRLRDAGYDCWATGKLDLWEHKDFGFREFETVHEHSVGPDITSLFRAPVCSRANERQSVDGNFNAGEHEDERRAANIINFLENESPKIRTPWCAYAGFTEPHPKFTARAEYEAMYPPAHMPLPQWPDGYLERRHQAFQILAGYKNIQLPIPTDRIRRARAAYFGMITELDKRVGRIMDALDRSGQRERTVVVYTSDHGEMLGEHGLWLKNTLLDNAARVPLILSGPGIAKAKVVQTPVSHVDLVATLTGLTGASSRGLRGRSLLQSDRPPFAYSESHSEGNCTGSFMIRTNQWKYIYFTGGDPLLFDMSQPAGEFQDLAKDSRFASVRRQLHENLTSLVDPDPVTFQAFRKQDEVLRRIVGRQSKAEFYKSVAGRLGSMQATVLAERYYTRPKG